MALKKIYFGSVGPFLYDDADLINDPDGDFSGEYFDGVVTDGKLRQKQPASSDDDCVRKADIDAKIVSYTTETKTVVTNVDFANETFTTESITYVTDVTWG